MNLKDEVGVGYLVYSAGKLSYNESFGIIEFKVGSVKKTKTKSKTLKKSLLKYTRINLCMNIYLFIAQVIPIY